MLVSETTIRISSDSYFREHMPWRQGVVTADCGPQIIAHLHGECVEGQKVRLTLQLDKSGQAVIFALPLRETPNMQDDPQLREMTADPRHRRVLITDGRNPVGQALTRALRKAEAGKIFVGIADPWKPFPGEELLRTLENVEIVPLDLTDEKSVSDLASDIGAKIDILVNTSDHTRPQHLFDQGGARKLSEAMDTMLLGSMRLAQAFGPVMLGRGADGAHSAVAWVNVLSAYALANLPAYGAVSVSHAACLSLSHWLRAELRPGGIRLLNAFAGPLETEWYQTMPPPKVAPSQLAEAIVDGLRRGLEEIYVGDIAKDIRERLAANPKALEREIGQ
jgi:NAD(P)-dependent dehydrogenase (short-subunit alcohol dehydrogenase family)